MKRVEISKDFLDRFNEDHFDSITKAAFYVADDSEVTYEQIVEHLLALRKQHIGPDNPPKTGLVKSKLGSTKKPSVGEKINILGTLDGVHPTYNKFYKK